MGANLSQFVWCVSTSIALVFAAILLSAEGSNGNDSNDNDNDNDHSNSIKVYASCGIVVDEDGKKCDACEFACKHKKRASEGFLFKQPNKSTHLEDCSICCLPFSYDLKESSIMPCCCERICIGCEASDMIREKQERLEHKCPFCRHPAVQSSEVYRQCIMNRIEVKDPVAMQIMGTTCYHQGHYDSAANYLTRAAELDNAEAHYQLSNLYSDGLGVEMDKEKERYHLEVAAIGGHPIARYNLGVIEWNSGRKERATKHWIIGANHGHDLSLHWLKEGYIDGYVSKEDFAVALRAHQAAVDATKSPQRQSEAAGALEIAHAFEWGIQRSGLSWSC